ncbi:MAG: diguanylate cyclase [Dehalococcoidia bacterium]
MERTSGFEAAEEASERYAYLAENLASVHASPDMPWLTGRLEFIGEKAFGAALTVLALSDERGVYRPSASASPRPATARDLWQELEIDALASNDVLRAALTDAEQRADAIALPFADLFGERGRDAGVDSVIVAPIAYNREHIGVALFCVDDSPATQHMVNILASHAAVAIYQLRQREEARRLHSVDRRLWVPDEDFLLALLRREVTRARRYGREVGLAVLWLDNEPDIRQRFGDFFTDHLLRRIGGQLLATVRDSDILGAVGGRYAVIHTETGIDGTQLSAGRLRDVVCEMVARRFPEVPQPQISIRCAAFPTSGMSVEDLLTAVIEGKREDAA